MQAVNGRAVHFLLQTQTSVDVQKRVVLLPKADAKRTHNGPTTTKLNALNVSTRTSTCTGTEKRAPTPAARVRGHQNWAR